MSKNYLQLLSFKIDETTMEEIFSQKEIYSLFFPRELRQFLNRVEDKERSQFISHLNKTLQLSFPQIFFTSHSFKNYWLLSFEAIDLTHIKLIVDISLQEHFEEAYEIELEKWKRIKGYKDLHTSSYFSWIPAFFAREFANSGRRKIYINPNKGEDKYPILNEKVNFHYVQFNSSFECVSDIIQREDSKGKLHGNYSYVIKFEYKNRAFLPEMGILNVKVGIRRYIEKGISGLQSLKRGRKAGSMMVQVPSPFLGNKFTYMQWKYRLNRGKVYWDYTTKAFITYLKNYINIDWQPFDILTNPLNYREDGKKALPVFSHQTFHERSLTNTMSGVGLQEKQLLFSLVEDSFPFLSLLPKGREIPKTTMNKQLLPFKLPIKEAKRITLEIWGSEYLREEFIRIHQEEKDTNEIQIKPSDQGSDLYTLELEQGTIALQIIRRNPEGIVRERKKAETADNFKKRTMDRLRDFPKEGICLSLVEILRREDYGPTLDPKALLREAFARTGRLTQFIHPIEDASPSNRSNRLKNSFKDLLADLGLIPHKVERALEDDTVIFSVGKLQEYNKFTPILSCFSKSIPLQVKVYFRNWESFPQALLNMVDYEKHFFNIKDDQQESLEKFIFTNLKTILEETKGKVIVVFDQFYRRYFSKLQNGQLNKVIEWVEEQELTNYRDRLRFVRVSNLDEIPQYKLWDGKNSTFINYKSGLFSTNENLYYSIGMKMDHAKNISKAMIKYGNLNKLLFHQSIVEIVTLGADSVDENDAIARTIHRLRRLAITTDTGTTMPYPLHLYKSFAKYVPLPIYTGDLEDEVNSFGEKDGEFISEIEASEDIFSLEKTREGIGRTDDEG